LIFFFSKSENYAIPMYGLQYPWTRRTLDKENIEAIVNQLKNWKFRSELFFLNIIIFLLFFYYFSTIYHCFYDWRQKLYIYSIFHQRIHLFWQNTYIQDLWAKSAFVKQNLDSSQLIFLQTLGKDHTGKFEHKCPECNKSFLTHKKLVTHVVSHKYSRISVVCEICDKTFTKNSIKNHKGTIHILRNHL
jgi:uncharacterized protein with PIN domain